MRALLLTFLSWLFLFISNSTQAQENLGHTWSNLLNNSSLLGGNVNGRSIKTDAAGNIYITGEFNGWADFDPGAGSLNLASIGSNDIFLAKYNASGNLVYARQIGSINDDIGYNLSLDLSGNLYITGYFQGTVDFNTGTGTNNLVSAGNYDIFFAKYDANGNYVYARNIGGTSDDRGRAIVADESGNVYLSGYFTGTADFDPGTGTANLTSVTNSNDIFFAKYDANGNYVYARNVGGSSTDQSNSLTIDGSGNVYLTGYFNGTADFDPGAGTANLISAGQADLFYAKYNSSGNYVYAKRVGTTFSEFGHSLAVDANGNIYITGQYSSTVDFDPGAGTANLTSANGFDIFFVKYDANGDYVYARGLAGATSSSDAGYGLALDGNANVYITGMFAGTIDFDPGAGTANITSTSNTIDIFFAKYDVNGNYVYARAIGGISPDGANSITVDGSGNAYITGSFGSTADFDPGAGINNLTTGGFGLANSFLARYNSSGNYSFAGLLGGNNNSVFNEDVRSITVDGSGNVYITGSFEGTVDFDPSSGTANLTSTGTQDIYFAKYDANGNYVYAKAFGSVGSDLSYGIKTDGSGNVYITGYFTGTIDFDPGPAAFNLTTAGSFDIFLAKYDANGNYVYAKALGGTGLDAANSIAVDGSGNVYITGFFQETADFDPGAGVANLSSNSSSFDFFFAKYDASGNYVYAKSLGGSNTDIGNSIAVDGSGNVYVLGTFSGTMDFDPGAGTVNLSSLLGSVDVFFAKYNTSGAYVYAKRLGGSNNDNGNSLAVDGSGNVYVTGNFDGTADFDPGAGTVNLSSAANSVDVFLGKYDASGNYVYAKAVGGNSSDYGNSIAVDATGNVYLTGYYQGTADFDPGAGTVNLSSLGGGIDIYVAKYNASGNYVYAITAGGSNNDIGSSITLDANSNVYISGIFQGTIDCDPGTASALLIASNSNDVFFAKYSGCTTPQVSSINSTANPAAVSGATSLTDGGCRLVAVVAPNGTSPVSGTVNAQVWIESSVPTFAGVPFVARHYEITPVTNPSTATGRVTLYFTQQEFTDFNNHPGSTLNLPTGAADAAGISNLRIGKYNGTSNNGTGLPGSYTNGSTIIDPADSDIVWNATLSRWEVSFDVTGFSGFIVQTVSSTLPVTLLEFNAQRNAQTTVLNWSTASEQNNKGFTVQRSSNGRSFTDLGFVPAAADGNSTVTQHYRFTDAAPLNGRNYYRLLQQDNDGTSKGSEIRIVDFSNNVVIAMYPNPTASVLNISISSAGNQPLQLRITDITGRVLKTRNYNNASGTIQLNVDDMAKGTYFLELWMNNEKQVSTFIKQ